MSDIEHSVSQSPLFSAEEEALYARHLRLPELGLEGQKKLKAAKVLVVGAGGLGSPLLLYLAAAGVGRIGIVDGDRVDHSNLHRQVLYTTEDVGKPKVQVAKERLQKLNSHIKIDVFFEFLNRDNALDIINQYDVIADGSDNFPTRYLVNDACVICHKVNVYASIFRFEGQVSVFNYVNKDGSRGVNYRDLYPVPPAPDSVPNCAESGVLGVLPGIIGSMQASEVIKIITSIGEPLTGRLFVFDAASFSSFTLNINKKNNIRITELLDYEQFCHSPLPKQIKAVSIEKLHQLKTENTDFQLIDVREFHEHQDFNIGGELIPLSELTQNRSQIAKDKIVIIHCQSGKRSSEAIQLLESLDNYTNLYNLEGGIEAWKQAQSRK